MDDPHQVLRDLRAYLNRRNGEAVLLGEVNLPPKDVRTFLGDEDGDELHMVLDFIGNQALYLALARGEAEPLAQALRDFPDDPAIRIAGPVRAQPRRADARQAERGRARGGVRALRARPGACSSTAAGCGGGCRRCSAATRARSGWSTRSRSRCPARRCCSTARRSGWPRTSAIEGRYAVRRADAVVAGRRVLDHDRAAAADGRGRVRAGAGERRRPAPRPGLAAELVRAPDPAPARVPGARLRDAHAARDRRAVGARPPLRLGGLDDRRRARARRAVGRGRRCRSPTARRSSTCSATRSTRCPRRCTSSPTPRTGSACGARACAYRP